MLYYAFQKKVTMERWPNFFFVGAPRSGSTSLYYYLKQIPEIYMCPGKEPHYFHSSKFRDMYGETIRDEKKYLELFQGVENEVAVGEATASYLEDPESPALIHQVVPHAKIIMILRDPIERAFSHYLVDVRLKLFKLSFHDIIRMDFDSLKKNPYMQEILEAGFYSQQVIRYLQFFGTDKVKILIFEEFIRDPKGKVEEILRFLDVNHNFHDFKVDAHNEFAVDRVPFAQDVINNMIIRKIAHCLMPASARLYVAEKILAKKIPKPKMAEEDRIFLQNLYRDDVQKLGDILGRQLPWPNFRKTKEID
jgi:hypothetical protein